mgnify:CR=1 FL=1
MSLLTITKVNPNTLLKVASLIGDHDVALAEVETITISKAKALATTPAFTKRFARFFP